MIVRKYHERKGPWMASSSKRRSCRHFRFAVPKWSAAAFWYQDGTAGTSLWTKPAFRKTQSRLEIVIAHRKSNRPSCGEEIAPAGPPRADGVLTVERVTETSGEHLCTPRFAVPLRLRATNQRAPALTPRAKILGLLWQGRRPLRREIARAAPRNQLAST